MPKIVFLDAKTVGDVPTLHQLKDLGELIVYPSTSPEQVLDRIKGCAVVITNKVVIDKPIMEQSPELRLICVAATGMNNVDMEYARQRGIEVKNVVGYSTNSVAQVTFSLILSLLTQIAYYDDYVKSGEYAKTDIFTHIGREFWEIAGKKFGIIGLGTIGKKVAIIAEAFGAEVIYYSTSGRNDNATYSRVELVELLQRADIVSIHSPLNDNTRNLINYERIKQMKPTAILVNTGRGGIVNEADLARALNENLIAGAGLDVLEKEPILSANPLLSVENKSKLVIVPHIAWSSIEARTELMQGVCQNIQSFFNKQT